MVRTSSGGLRARGWALDPDKLGPITVHLYVTGGGAYPVPANSSRPDIADAFPGYGRKHGFIGTLPGTTGKHTVLRVRHQPGPRRQRPARLQDGLNPAPPLEPRLRGFGPVP